ncbi:MAG: ArsA-related P-loop ATPase [Myxococcota bacterium]
MAEAPNFRALLSRPVVLVTGKGGVGKTTVAAALGLRAARMGMRPLVVGCDGKPTLARILGGAPEGPRATNMGQGVHALRVDFDEALADLIGEILSVRKLVEAFLHNRVVRTFVHAAPSVMELSLLHRVDRARSKDEPGGPFSPVIVDLPASGHALALMATPRAVMRLVRMGPLYRRASELLALVNDPQLTALCAVTLAEELPVNETIELVGRARGLGVPVGHVVVNAVPPSPLSSDDAELMTHLSQQGQPPLAHWAQEALHGSTRSRRARAEIERLASVATGPLAEVPFVSEAGPRLTASVCDALGEKV